MKERLRQFRKDRQMSQQQFAVELGLSVATIHRWEGGKTRPSPLALESLKRIGFKK